MKILVCVKQVPRLDRVGFDRANRIVREDVPNLCNPLDELALGHALSVRSGTGEVVAVTMGPPAAREILADAIHRGADRAIHLTDRRFKGADTLATARALAEIVRREGPDLVLFGRGTLDGATAQLGQQVAELAGLSQSTEAVDVRVDGHELIVERETGHGREDWRMPLPAAVTVARGPRPPDPAPGRTADIAEVTADDLEGKPVAYGTRGSPTFVKEVRVRSAEPRREAIASVEQAAERVRELAAGAGDDGDGTPWQRQPGAVARRDVWVLVERDGRALDPITFEGLACARDVAAQLDARVTAVLLSAEDGGAGAELAARGADRVLHVRDPLLRDYATGPYVDALAAALGREQPSVLIAPWTTDGRDYVPRVAARLGLGLTGDVTGVEVEAGDDPRLGWVKPSWAGTADALVISRTTPTVATLRPGSYRPLRRAEGVGAEVETVEPRLESSEGEPRLVSSRREVDDCLLDRAGVVFVLGADVPAESAARVVELAGQWRAGVGGTAEAVRLGLVPPQWELGVLKRSIAPAVCVALGVADAHDVAAVRGCSTLVTVHPQADASVHERADVQVVGDTDAFVKELPAHPV